MTADKEPLDAPDRLASPDRPHDEALAASDMHRAVRRLIAALPRKLRDALLLAGSGEYTYDQIGVMLGTPTGTVKWRVSEARRLLRAKLEALGYGTNMRATGARNAGTQKGIETPERNKE